MVKPDGRMVYATCSVFPRENEEQVRTFLAHNNDWSLLRELNLSPEEGDGFYAALLKKNS